MVVTNPILAVIYLVTLPLSFIMTSFISKKSKKEFKRQQTAMGALNAAVLDTFTNHMVVKAYGCENEKSDTFNKLNDECLDFITAIAAQAY